MDNEFWESEELDETEIEQDDGEVDETFTFEDEQAPDHLLEETESQEDVEDRELISNARLRLEQGKLYEMLLKHDLFGTVEADSRAIANVQKEIRTFIKARLEILLGLKPDPKLQPIQQEIGISQPSQFTELEVELLKRFLSKLSKGATEKLDQTSQVVQKAVVPASIQSQGLRPLSTPVNRQSSLRGFQGPSAPLAAKEPPSQINVGNQKIKKILEEQFGENEMPLGKPANKLKRSELIERNKRIAQRQAARKASNVGQLPPPTAAQEEAIMMQHVYSRNESLQNSGVSPLTLAIGKTLANKAGQSE